MLADYVVPRCPLLGSVCSLAFPPCAKSMVRTAPGRVPLPGLLWLRVSVLSTAVLAPTKPSRYTFSARSNLDPTVGCDVTKSCQKSRGQRGKREREGETRLGSTNLSAPKRQKKTKIECLRVTSLKIKFLKLLNLSRGTTSKSVIAKEKSISGQIVSQMTPYKIFLNFNRS